MPKGKEAKKAVKGRKYVATVMEITHGNWFRNHKHYAVKVIEVDEDFNIDLIEEGAVQASRVSSKLLGFKTRCVSNEEIDITTIEDIRATGKAFKAAIKK